MLSLDLVDGIKLFTKIPSPPKLHSHKRSQRKKTMKLSTKLTNKGIRKVHSHNQG